MTARIINGVDEAKALVGEHLGYSDYLDDQDAKVNQFAEATGTTSGSTSTSSVPRPDRSEGRSPTAT